VTQSAVTAELALARFKAGISFVDHIEAAFAAHNLAIAVAVFQ